ncbi:hypothetical protein SORBI_3001G030800 [Sorghum bicolor]|uniref:NAC domain-containing protein n=1 Tax=Sorghum bicolor TaxID=4558 RepID=A0A1Z5S456_SORBI|nr:hypothetical protein SORBI_3001G030800 [Sorghum bicolor]
MATNDDDDVFRPTDEASIALLRGLRTKTIVDRSFIHRADVCSAAPEELVADLQPVPGTDATEDGYNSVWYIYCPKRYKNTRGNASGHRQRALEVDAKMRWHSETGPKPVQGVPGATFCNLSYGRKEKDGASGRQRLDRMGWCMTEFDDTQGGGGDHVLCRLHRSSSSLAKKKYSKSSSSSSKRKAAGDHPEAPPIKLIHDDVEQVQQEPAASFFPDAYPTMPCYGYGPPQGVDPVTMIGGEEEYGVQQPHVEPEYGGEFNFDELLNIDEQEQQVQMQDPAAFFTNADPTMPCYGYGPPEGVNPVTMVGGEEERGVQQPQVELEAEHVDGGEFNVEELLNMEEFTNAYPTTTTMPSYVHGGPQGVDYPAMFGGEEEHGVGVQQPHVESEAEHGGDLGGFNLEELLNKDDWNSFLKMLQAEGEQGQQQQQPCAEPEPEPEQGGGIVISRDLLYAC